MPEYRRAFQPGGTFIFTVVTNHRYPLFTNPAAPRLLGQVMRSVRATRPFDVAAIVLLPEHLHCIWELPSEGADFSSRWARIKKDFSTLWVESGGRQASVTESKRRRRGLGVWQERFWEHTIRDEKDLIRHIEYIHYNPVKHGHVSCPHLWPYSSFRRCERKGVHEDAWGCVCENQRFVAPDFSEIEGSVKE